MTKFTLNDAVVESKHAPDTPLLWVIRDEFDLTGTKFGCGIAQCGACTVHQDGVAIRACITPIEFVEGTSITTIEGLGEHPLKDAWVQEQVPQCGWCQSGQIMNAAALLDEDPNPTDDAITSAMDGNLCRCMSYVRIRRAIHTAARMAAEADGDQVSPTEVASSTDTGEADHGA